MAQRRKSPWLTYLIYTVLLGLLALVVVQQREAFGNSIELLTEVNPLWTVGGLAVFLLSVFFSSGVYQALSPKPLHYSRTLQVQLASLLVNKVLPAGSGALGINYLYLRANKLSRTVAAAVVAGNNLLGFVAHICLLVVSCLIFSSSLPDHGVFSARGLALTGLVIVWTAAVALIVYHFGRWQAPAFVTQLHSLSKSSRLPAAFLCAVAITACYAAGLAVACLAFSYSLSPAALMVTLSFGVAAASALPTPGGIGAAEAGIFAGLHNYGLPTADALSIAILYRIITFWLPMIGGLGGIYLLHRNKLLSPKRPPSKRGVS
jgi:uncharacterized membrane protein YbhN (UPF0104 family)